MLACVSGSLMWSRSSTCTRFILAPIDANSALWGGSEPPHKALFASIGAKMKRVHVLDLDHINDPLTQASIRRIDLDQAIRDVVPVPERELAMLVHDDARTCLLYTSPS